MEKVNGIFVGMKGLLKKYKCGHFIISRAPQGQFNKKCPDCGGYALTKDEEPKQVRKK